MSLNSLCLALAIAAASGVALAPAAAAQQRDSPVERLLPRGKDGSLLYYQVRCKNETIGTLVLDDTRGNICAQAQGGERVCRADWTLPRAAEQACR